MKRLLENATDSHLQCKRLADAYTLDKEFRKEINDLTLKKLKDGAQRTTKESKVACRMCLEQIADGFCSSCDRRLCTRCVHQCEQCDGNVCGFCYVVDYTKRWDQRSCVNCNQKVSVDN